MCVSLLTLFVLCVFSMWVISNHSISKTHVICVKPSLNSMFCWGHPFRTYAHFLPPDMHTCVRIRGVRNVSFSEYFCTYLMDETLHKTQQGVAGANVPTFNKFRSIISLSKITHQIWCDDTFSQRDKATIGGLGTLFQLCKRSELVNCFHLALCM